MSHSYLKQVQLVTLAAIARGFILAMKGAPRPLSDQVIKVLSREAGRTIAVNVYNPPNPTHPTPVLINFHGSGFILPRHGEDDEFCRTIANKTGHTVLDCPYRLAPAHPYPAAIEDTEDVVNWVLSQPSIYDLSKLSISGFSAGGNLALVAAGVSFPKDTFKAVLTFYPATDWDASAEEMSSAPDPSMKPQINPRVNDVVIDCFLPPGSNKRDPRISPQYADAERFPRTVLVISAAGDSLCWQDERFVQKLREAGGERVVVHKRMEKVNHAFDKEPKAGSLEERAKDDAYALTVKTLMDATGL